MYEGKKVGVVIPAYNEEGLVGEVIDTLPAIVDRAYVIDDCSVDGTWDEIMCHSETFDNHHTDGGTMLDTKPVVTPIRHKTNRGVGRSIKTGYERALQDGIDVIAVMNGDGQMNPDDLPRIIRPVVEESSDYAKGNRLSSRLNQKPIPPWRLFGNYLLTLFTRIASGYWEMRDSQNGYTAISAETLESIPFRELYDEYGFLNDLMTCLHMNNITIADVPHEAVYDDEQSHINYSSFIPKVSTLLLRNFVTRLRREYLENRIHPVIVSYALGIIGLVGGILGQVYSSLVSVESDQFRRHSSLFFLFGLAGTSIGLSWDIRESSGFVEQTGQEYANEGEGNHDE